MPPRLNAPIVPQCVSCLHSHLDSSFLGRWRLLNHQVRGAKTNSDPIHQPSTVVVQLSRHLNGWGKEGSYVPVPSGLMRNRWLPNKWARYVVGEELLQLRERKAIIERNTQFDVSQLVHSERNKKSWNKFRGRARNKKGELKKLKREQMIMEELGQQNIGEPMARVVLEHVEPERAIRLLEALLPSKLQFHRTAIKLDSQDDAIYGSVSTQDIVQSIRSELLHNDEAARISVSEDDIKFLNLPEGEDGRRVKRLGQFEVEISQKGTDRTLRRPVIVLGQDKEDPSRETSNPFPSVL